MKMSIDSVLQTKSHNWLIQRGTGQSAAIRTLYENLADMGGLKISKRAFDIYLKKNR